MPYLRYIFFQITLLVTNNVLAQESDTIYIHQDPLIVKKQVVMLFHATFAKIQLFHDRCRLQWQYHRLCP